LESFHKRESEDPKKQQVILPDEIHRYYRHTFGRDDTTLSVLGDIVHNELGLFATDGNTIEDLIELNVARRIMAKFGGWGRPDMVAPIMQALTKLNIPQRRNDV
jgi:hypothetical protein